MVSPVSVTADAARSLALFGTPASLGAAAAVYRVASTRDESYMYQDAAARL